MARRKMHLASQDSSDAPRVAVRVARPPVTNRRRLQRWLIRLLAGGSALLCCMGATGFGAGSESATIGTTVNETISLTEPSAIDTTPDPTNNSTWTPGSPSTLRLGTDEGDGDLVGQSQASASLTFTVTTNANGGYELQVANARGSGAVLQTADNVAFPDISDTPAALDTDVTAFGMAVGDSINHDQVSVDNIASSPWGTTGGSGTQGTLYRGIPTAGVIIATQATAVENDPVTLNFVANLSSSQPQPPGAYTGSLTMTVTAL